MDIMLLNTKQPEKITEGLFTLFRRSFLLLFFIIISVLNVAVAEEMRATGQASQFIKNTHGTLLAVDKPVDGAKIVTLGMYGINIYNMDVRTNTYHMTAYLWLRWKGDFDPVGSLEFINVVDSWGLTKTILLSKPKLLSNGEKYQEIRIDGAFFQPFNLNSYPLDKQELALYIENSTDSYDQISYVPDKNSSGFDRGLLVPGWKVIGLSASSYIHDYGTDFGDVGTANASKYSVVKFSFEIERYTNFFIWKLFVPMLIILMTNWLSLILKPTFIEVRTAMPTTALLTIVFLQQSALDAIPGCPSLVLMDKIYLLAYFCVVMTLLQIIWVNMNLDKESSSSIAKMKKIDRISFVAQILFFTIVFVVLIMNS
ncbi:MAG: hypothetical protein JZU70_06440 [Chlorobium sp.]|jgi:hypothetical protein|nr:hypothetical protein [Chlorobium sp.]